MRHRFYVHHETPAGDRCVYPRPDISEVDSVFGYGARNVVWRGVDKHGVSVEAVLTNPPRDAHVRNAVPYLITRRPVVEFVVTWSTAGGYGAWRKVQERPAGVLGQVWDSLPAMPTDDVIAVLHNADEENQDDRVLRQLHHRKPLPDEQHEARVDVADMVALPGEPDPAPSQEWTTDPTAAAIYGTHATHLFPGELHGFRDAVVEALEQHPSRPKVYSHTAPKVSVFMDILWDVPVRRAKVKGDRGSGPFLSTKASTHHVELRVPMTLGGASKAAALAAWDDAVQEWVAKFLPTSTLQACSACEGRGFLTKTP